MAGSREPHEDAQRRPRRQEHLQGATDTRPVHIETRPTPASDDGKPFRRDVRQRDRAGTSLRSARRDHVDRARVCDPAHGSMRRRERTTRQDGPRIHAQQVLGNSIMVRGGEEDRGAGDDDCQEWPRVDSSQWWWHQDRGAVRMLGVVKCRGIE